jgi:hypothetical protein
LKLGVKIFQSIRCKVFLRTRKTKKIQNEKSQGLKTKKTLHRNRINLYAESMKAALARTPFALSPLSGPSAKKNNLL